MADTKVSDLTALTTFSGDETFYVVEDDDGTPVSRKITIEDLAAGLAARSELAAAFVQTTHFIPAASWVPVTGSPVLADAGTDVPGYLMDAATSERVGSMARVPIGWTTYDASVVWTNAGAGSGNVVWQLSYRASFGDGESIAVDTSPSNQTVAAPAQDTAKFTSIATGVSVPTSGELATFRVTRVGGDAGDTLANDAAFVGLLLTKAS